MSIINTLLGRDVACADEMRPGDRVRFLPQYPEEVNVYHWLGTIRRTDVDDCPGLTEIAFDAIRLSATGADYPFPSRHPVAFRSRSDMVHHPACPRR